MLQCAPIANSCLAYGAAACRTAIAAVHTLRDEVGCTACTALGTVVHQSDAGQYTLSYALYFCPASHVLISQIPTLHLPLCPPSLCTSTTGDCLLGLVYMCTSAAGPCCEHGCLSRLERRLIATCRVRTGCAGARRPRCSCDLRTDRLCVCAPTPCQQRPGGGTGQAGTWVVRDVR